MNIMLVDDETEALRSMEMTLRFAGYNDICSCSNGTEAIERYTAQRYDILILDIMMPHTDGIMVLQKVREINPDALVIMVSGVQEITTAVECMREGALDYLLKPIDAERLLSAIRNAARICDLQKENTNLTRQLLTPENAADSSFEEIVTQHEAMINLFKYIEAIAATNQPVLITGETGTGKELFARALHNKSGVQGKFVAVNVAGIDDTVFSDTLFGHAKGAFTGADSVRKGLIESAAGGTLFLDEIGDLSTQSQTKLLRLLQEKEYFPLGSDLPQLSKARIITATCRNIDQIGNSADFRKDLYYRLRTHHITIPPLRARKDDLELLTRYYVKKAAEELGKPIPFIPRELFTLLSTYSFPGNIRELQAMIFDIVSAHKGNTLSLEQFRIKMGDSLKCPQLDSPEDSMESSGGRVTFGESLPTLSEIENMLIDEALNRTKGNQSMAAHLLGITRQALGKRLKNRLECV